MLEINIPRPEPGATFTVKIRPSADPKRVCCDGRSATFPPAFEGDVVAEREVDDGDPEGGRVVLVVTAHNRPLS